jgi:hypothetical protein
MPTSSFFTEGDMLVHVLHMECPIECRNWRMCLRRVGKGSVKLSHVRAGLPGPSGNAEPCILDEGSNYFPDVEEEIRKHELSYNEVPPQDETW